MVLFLPGSPVIHRAPVATVLVLGVFVGGACGGHPPAARFPGDIFRKHYVLTISAPRRARAGESVVTKIKVTPTAPYKINLEYPTWLSLNAPEGVLPRTMAIKADGAARHSPSEILFEPRFTVHNGGGHRISGELRFSVCKDQLCDLEQVPVAWDTEVSP